MNLKNSNVSFQYKDLVKGLFLTRIKNVKVPESISEVPPPAGVSTSF